MQEFGFVPQINFGFILPNEGQVLTFLLGPRMPAGAVLTGTPTVSVFCDDGNDLTPNNILVSQPQISTSPIVLTLPSGAVINAPTGTAMLVAVMCTLPGARYILRANCGSSVQGISPSGYGLLRVSKP